MVFTNSSESDEENSVSGLLLNLVILPNSQSYFIINHALGFFGGASKEKPSTVVINFYNSTDDYSFSVLFFVDESTNKGVGLFVSGLLSISISSCDSEF